MLQHAKYTGKAKPLICKNIISDKRGAVKKYYYTVEMVQNMGTLIVFNIAYYQALSPNA